MQDESREMLREEETGAGAPVRNTAPPEEEEPSMAQKVAALPEKKWTLIQYALGLAFGLAGGYLLCILPKSPEFSAYGFPAAILLLVLGPRLLQGQLQQDLHKMRLAMILSFVLFLGLNLLFSL